MATAAGPDVARKPKLAILLARQIEDEIAARGWPVGEVIASESELVDQFEVSRAVFREAIRIVEHTGAAHMRRGPGGGLVIDRPSRDVVASAAGVYFASLGVTVAEMLDASQPLVRAAVELAARRATAYDVRSVVTSMDEMAAHRRLGAEDFVDLQRRVTDLSGNPVLGLFDQALGDVGVSRLEGTGARLDPPLSVDDALVHLRGYRRLVEAIAAHDPDDAVERVVVLQRALRERLHDRPMRPRARPPAADGEGKLGERIARLIREDIEREGWHEGKHVASEPILVERYGVSRSVLREAIRILEFQGAVATRRGRNGGLFVARPDSSAVVQSARVVMDFERVDAGRVWEAREIVEDVCIRLATERLDDETSALLTEALAEEGESEHWGVSEHVVHHALAQATRNRPLVMFVDVLAELSTARVRSAVRGTDPGTLDIAEAHRAHKRIVEAVLDGDQERASARMRRHIRAAATSY